MATYKPCVAVTGGAGFIGSAVVRRLVSSGRYRVVNIDRLTYAGNQDSLRPVHDHPEYHFVHEDICNESAIEHCLSTYRPDAILHLAAESHVDRSITGPAAFVQTNVVGTLTLLECARRYFDGLIGERRDRFRFVHVSTDEVYGDLGPADPPFTEQSPYEPSSPYSASKAASDHLARAWHRTYGLPTIVTNCSNNYGPYQFPEKLIPLMTIQALSGKPLPVYGDGQQVRDWLFVDDHVGALVAVLDRGLPGSTYNIGSDNEQANLDVVNRICARLEQSGAPKPQDVKHFDELITFVTDRPGHDRRYAIDNRQIRKELGWKPTTSFEEGLDLTVDWYVAQRWWWERVLSGAYRTTGGKA